MKTFMKIKKILFFSLIIFISHTIIASALTGSGSITVTVLPQNCVGSWSACSGGSHTFTISTPKANGGADCSPAVNTTESCGTNGGWSAWSAWSACSVTACGLTGTQTSTRTCTPPQNGGVPCSSIDGGNSSKTQACSTATCPSGSISASNCTIPAGSYSCSTNITWSTSNPITTSAVTTPTSITVASANSSAGTSYTVVYGNRTFYLYNNGSLLNQSTATASCTSGTGWYGGYCRTPINGGWTAWSAQNPSCGYSGTQTRTCNNPTPANGGADCSGPTTQTYTNAACAPATPTGLNVSPSSCGNNWLNLWWNASSGATNYKVYRGGTLVYDGSGLGFSDTGLTLGTSYSYTINASNAGGTSANSTAVSGTVASSCTCANGANNPPTCTTFTPCANGATNPPTCTTIPPCTAPLNQNVTVACDLNIYEDAAISGLVTRSQIKSAYPGCTFPALPITVANSTYVSDTCVYPVSSGSLTTSPCTISVGNNSCDATLTWDTSNPVGGVTSVVKTSTGTTIETANSGTTTYAVPYNNRTFVLVHNGVTLDTKTSISSCTTNTHWDSSTSKCKLDTPGTTTTFTAAPSTIFKGKSSTLTWNSPLAISCTGTGFSTGVAGSLATIAGSVVISPTATTTYTLSCTNTSGTSDSTVITKVITLSIEEN